MSYAPCKNPNCKSFGKPHPNCRCYGGMADGGEVGFCNDTRSHNKDCEYFSDGGQVEPIDHMHAVAGHISNNGINGLLKFHVYRDAETYGKSVKNGHKKLERVLENVFNNGKPSKFSDEGEHQYIDDWISKGGVINDLHQDIHNQSLPQEFAHGGNVGDVESKILNDHPVAHMHPEQNIAINAAKSRVSGYLDSLKPKDLAPKLAFDDMPDQSGQKRQYKKALAVAHAPLSVLDHISRGTFDPEHLQHLMAMYPELHGAMSKKATEKIIHAQMNGKKPNYKVRQGLSLLLGTNLSGEMLPENIAAAQATFNKQSPQNQQAAPIKAKKGTAPLSKSDDSFLTGGQALAKRAQKV